jgi:hypothetical protein
MSADQPESISDLLDNAPPWASATADLYRFSVKFEPGAGPFLLFAQVVRYEASDGSGSSHRIEPGPPPRTDEWARDMENDLLERAMGEYERMPTEIRGFVEELLRLEDQR